MTDTVIDYVQVTDPAQCQAVENGEIEGERYKDGECWANPAALAAWIEVHQS
jgi:hypothetical protein